MVDPVIPGQEQGLRRSMAMQGDTFADVDQSDDISKPALRRLTWELHRALTAERLEVCARLLVRGRAEAFRLADPWAGDDAWSIGYRAYSFSVSVRG